MTQPGRTRLWIIPVVDPGFSRGKGLGYYTSKLKVPKKTNIQHRKRTEALLR